jgi:hypothetical protein
VFELTRWAPSDSAALAVRLGWYDRAHFINDFRSMLRCTAGEYATRPG